MSHCACGVPLHPKCCGSVCGGVFVCFFLSIERNGAMGKLVVLVDLIYAHSSPQLISCLGVCALAVFKCKTGEM